MKNSFFKKSFIMILLFIIIILFYSHFIGTKGLKIKEYSIINNKLTDNYHGLKIVHFTDLHYGTTYKQEDLKKLVNEINLLKPHIVIFTGDLIDKDYEISKDELVKVIDTLNKIDPEVSSYMVRGNHDYGSVYNEVLKNINISLLDNSSEFFYYNDSNPILIVGTEDYLIGDEDLPKAFELYNEQYYTIFITHEPDTVKRLDQYKPDLILAGHSHNGQVRIPFIGSIVKVDGAKTYYDEKYIVNNSEMYISGGLGTSKYPFRLFNPPSFNFYRLYNK